MRILSWLAALVVVLALAVGAKSVVSAHPSSTPPAGKPALAAAVNYPVLSPANDKSPRRGFPKPSPTPPPPAPAAAAPVAAAPAPAQPAPRPAPPAVVVGSTQQALINRDRAANGLGPLTWSSCLYNVARSNAARIAAQGYLSHTNGPSVDLRCGLGNRAGENIGYWTGGINDAQLNTMFMNSPEHRANILGPYRYVATAWVVASNGTAYIAVEFS
jgi:uncharacterized protein YkwD